MRALLAFIIFFHLTSISAWAGKKDSLLALLKTSGEDTNKVILLGKMARASSDESKYKDAIAYAEQARTLAEKLQFKKGMALAYSSIGLAQTHLGEYAAALKNLQLSYDIQSGLNNKKNMAGALVNMANIYSYQGKYTNAVEYYYKAAGILEEIKYKPWLANVYNNLGEVNCILGEAQKGKENFTKSLKLFEEQNNLQGAAMTLSNLGGCFLREKNYKTALEYTMKAYTYIKKDMQEDQYKSILSDLGNIYYAMGNYSKALDNYTWALETSEKILDRSGAVNDHISIARVLLKRKNYAEAIKHLNTSLQLIKELGEQSKAIKAEKLLSEIYEEMGDGKAALEHFKKYILNKDSVYNEENTKKNVQAEMNFEFEKKEAATKLEQEKKEAVAVAESKKQKAILWSVCGILVLVFAFAVFAYRSYLQKQKANVEITRQKEVIEEKQKEILDSIYYARRIQRALIPSDRYILKRLQQLQK